MKTVARHSCERRTPIYHHTNMTPEFFSNQILQSVPHVIEHQIPLSQRINDVIDYYLNFDSSSIFDVNEKASEQKDPGKPNGNSSNFAQTPTNVHEHDSAVERCRHAPEKVANVRKKTILPVSENPASVFAPPPETVSSRSPNTRDPPKSPRLKKRLPVFSATAPEPRRSPGACRRSLSPVDKQAQSVSDVIRKWNLTTPDPPQTGNGSTSSCTKKIAPSPETCKTGSTRANRHLEVNSSTADSQKTGSPTPSKNPPNKNPPKCSCPEGSPIPVRNRDPKACQSTYSSRSKKSIDSPVKQSDRSIIDFPEKRQQKSDKPVTKPQDHSPHCRTSRLATGSSNPETTPTGSRVSAVEKLYKIHEPKEEEDGDALSIELFRTLSTSKMDLKSESLSNLLTRDDCLCHAAVHKSISGVMQSCLDTAPSGSGLEDPLILARSSQISNGTRVLYKDDVTAQSREPGVATTRNVGPEVRFKDCEAEESSGKTRQTRIPIPEVDPIPEVETEPEVETGRAGSVYSDFFKRDALIRGKRSRRASRGRKSEAVTFEDVQPEVAITRDLELNPRPEEPDPSNLLQNHVVLKSDVPLYDQNCHLLGYIKAGSIMYETAHDTRKKVKQYLRKTAPLLGLNVCGDECSESSNTSPPLSPDGGLSPIKKSPSLLKLQETLARIQSVL